MRLSALLLCAVLTAIVGFAPAPFPRQDRRKPVDDMDAMIGMWKMTTYESSGSAIGNHYKVRIRRNAWTFIDTQAQERESATYIYTLNTALSPRAFEWKSTPTSTYGWIGSYRLESRRRLEIIFSSGLMQQIESRPKDFGGRPSYRMVLEYIGRE